MSHKFYAFILPDKLCGIVYNWPDYDRLVRDVPHARYRGFNSRKEAFDFLWDGGPYSKRPHGPIKTKHTP